MTITTNDTPEHILQKCKNLYKKSIGDVYDYCNSLGLEYSLCAKCEEETPTIVFKDHHNCAVCGSVKETSLDSAFVWKSHIRNLLDEVIQNNSKMAIFHKPFQITMNILAEAAQHAVKIKDDKMIGFFARLALYEFSDPTNKAEFDQERTNYYINKTKA